MEVWNNMEDLNINHHSPLSSTGQHSPASYVSSDDVDCVFGSQLVDPNSTTPYTDATRTKKHQKGHVKRPMNAFMVWSQIERRRIISETPDMHNAQISKDLGRRWRAMTEEERQPFEHEANILVAFHAREYPGYKYKPKKAKKCGKVTKPEPSTKAPVIKTSKPKRRKQQSGSRTKNDAPTGQRAQGKATLKPETLRLIIDEHFRRGSHAAPSSTQSVVPSSPSSLGSPSSPDSFSYQSSSSSAPSPQSHSPAPYTSNDSAQSAITSTQLPQYAAHYGSTSTVTAAPTTTDVFSVFPTASFFAPDVKIEVASGTDDDWDMFDDIDINELTPLVGDVSGIYDIDPDTVIDIPTNDAISNASTYHVTSLSIDSQYTLPPKDSELFAALTN